MRIVKEAEESLGPLSFNPFVDVSLITPLSFDFLPISSFEALLTRRLTGVLRALRKKNC